MSCDTVEEEDFKSIFARLDCMFMPYEAHKWMQSNHPQLNGKTPDQAVKSGCVKEVHSILDRLDGSVYI